MAARKQDRLWDRFRAGDAEALSAVYRAHVDEVLRTARAVLRAHGARVAAYDQLASDLPDVVQEVFARAFAPRARCRFDDQRELRPYLLQIARNTAVDHWRAQRRHVLVDQNRLPERLIHLDGSGPRADEGWAGAEVIAVVERFIRSMSADERRWYEALYVRGLSQRQVSVELGVGRQVVRTMDSRLRARLKRALARAGHIEKRPALSPSSRKPHGVALCRVPTPVAPDGDRPARLWAAAEPQFED